MCRGRLQPAARPRMLVKDSPAPHTRNVFTALEDAVSGMPVHAGALQVVPRARVATLPAAAWACSLLSCALHATGHRRTGAQDGTRGATSKRYDVPICEHFRARVVGRGGFCRSVSVVSVFPSERAASTRGRQTRFRRRPAAPVALERAASGEARATGTSSEEAVHGGGRGRAHS